MIIGLTGSIAMGKSEVAKTLRQLGIPVFDADAAVHELYRNGTAAKALRNLCPDAVEGNVVDRKKLSRQIAENPSILKSITAIIHPLVNQAERDFLKSHSNKILVVDSPLLLETGRAADFDLIIVISSSPENQQARALSRLAMTLEKFNMIKTKQMPDDEKRQWADYIIDNNGSVEELREAVIALITEIKLKAKSNA
jgi:dephospho-CoA kinase